MLRRLLPIAIALASIAGAPDLRTVNGIAGILFWPADLLAANGDPRPPLGTQRLSELAGLNRNYVFDLEYSGGIPACRTS